MKSSGGCAVNEDEALALLRLRKLPVRRWTATATALIEEAEGDVRTQPATHVYIMACN